MAEILLSHHYFSCLIAFLVFVHALTSLISNCLSLLFGTQRRLRRLKLFSPNKRGTWSSFCTREVLAGSCSFLMPPPFSLIVLNSDRTRMGQESEDDSLIPGRGSKIMLAAHHNQKIWKKKKRVNKLWCIHTMKYYANVSWKTQCRSCELGFPGGTVAGNLPANCRGHGLDPWSRKVPHALGQLSLCATTAGAHML